MRFISLEEAIFFHEEEMRLTGGPTQIRDLQALKAALDAPKDSFGNAFLMDLYEMAATYIESICTHHPFLDGNKRTGTICALTFLYLNGYEIHEDYDEELADKVLALVTHEMDKSELAEYFRKKSRRVE